jgi:glucose/arabinose dehydrogenase
MKVFSALVLSAALFAADKKVTLPAPYHTPSVANGPKVIPQPEGKQLKLPPGFTAREFASGFTKPRYMLALPGGEVLVSDSIAKGSVYVIGPSKDKRTLLSGLDRPFGLALYKDWLYVTEAESIKRYKIDLKAVTVGSGEEIIALKGYGKGHWTRSMAIDEKAGKLYLSLGSGSNIDTGDPKDRAAINVYNLDGSGHEVFATGLRNPVSIRWNPVTKKIWTTVQERDGLGDDLVPDYLTEVKQGGFYGWPYAYIGPNEEPRHKGEAPELVTKTLVPDVVLGAHVAAMDFVFYTGKQFPSRYKNGVFLAQRGSNNRSSRVGYNVVFLPFKGGKPTGATEEFLSGWMMGPSEREVWGRPVGVLQMNDGSLLVSEDGNSKIWHISYRKM